MLKTHHSNWIATVLMAMSVISSYQIGNQERAQEVQESAKNVLWVDPGDPAARDFQYGVGGSDGQPQPPFRFQDEDLSGTSPKINVIDGRGASWNVKWGREPGPSTFCTRLVWACGYFTDTEYFLPEGRIEGANRLKRAGSHISHDGSFVNARFQLRTDAPKYLDGQSWTWSSNPFLGRREFQGLKILMLLVSNWDAKDARDKVGDTKGRTRLDSNLAIFEDNSTGEKRRLYADSDWGASLGKWGNTFTWTKWDCKGFTEQTQRFVKRGKNGFLLWGFDGKHREDLTTGISASDVQWLLQYLGRVTDEQIRSGLVASGATPAQTACYVPALRQRIEKLQQVASESPEKPMSSRTP